MTFAPQDTFGNTYVPQYFNYQVGDDELRPALIRRDTQMAIAMNLKENGIYETVEVQTGQQFFGNTNTQRQKRYTFRKAFVVAPIAAGASSGAIALNVSGITNFTNIYGTVLTATPDFRPIPHASVTANANIEVIMTASTYTINVGAGSPNVTSGILIVEYIKQ